MSSLPAVPPTASMQKPALIVLAKAPQAGAVKTRLCPPLVPGQAAAVAQAALLDTLDAVIAARAARSVLVLDGEPGTWLPPVFELVPQRSGGLSVRLADAFADVAGPALLIGMDTPQVTPRLLMAGLQELTEAGNDAVLGHTHDGGYWAIGLRRPDRRVFADVPMSTERTGAVQLSRLLELGLRVGALPRLRDVDRYEDALAVAREAPGTRFARTIETLEPPASESAAA
jgi:rSAM/selenodomain-associated transferase 1